MTRIVSSCNSECLRVGFGLFIRMDIPAKSYIISCMLVTAIIWTFEYCEAKGE